MRMPTTTMLALALLLGGCGLAPGTNDAAATTAATESSAPRDVFHSSLYPYSLLVPDGWTALPSGPDEDHFETTDHMSTLTVGTAVPEPGQTVEDRVRENRTQFAHCESDDRMDRSIQVDGEAGILWEIRCPGRYSFAANTIHDGLGYRLLLEVPADAEAEAHATMDEFLAGFAFTE